MSVFELDRTEGTKYSVPPAGLNPAVLVAIIDVGSHEKQGKNEKTGEAEYYTARSVFLAWELTDSKQDGYEDKNHFIGAEYTLSLGDRANLRKLIEEWRGRALGKDEGFKLATLLGRPCVLNVLHKQSQKGNAFAVVKGATNPRKTDVVPPATVEPFAWEVAGNKVPPQDEWLPYVWNPYVQKMTHVVEKITQCAEWKAANYLDQPTASASGSAAAGGANTSADGRDENPF